MVKAVYLQAFCFQDSCQPAACLHLDGVRQVGARVAGGKLMLLSGWVLVQDILIK